MQYRQFGKFDWDVSILGFGAMRLPTVAGKIDEAVATQMLYTAIDQGVNYVDTAYPYHDGASEVFVGKALQREGYRAKVKVATKMPSWLINEAADFDKYFDEQLTRLQMERVDCYLLHALNRDNWPKLQQLGVLEWAERQIAAGRIGHLGFSFHDDYPTFEAIVNAYAWEFCQIQYNYMDIDRQAGTKGLQLAASKGMAVIVMEPVLGGNLANPPQPIAALWEQAEQPRTPVDWALQWVWHHPEVTMLLSGVSSPQQIAENLQSADKAGINSLTAQELAIIAQVREKYRELRPIPCTQCGYCLPCPNHVMIPYNFDIYNKGSMFANHAGARGEYGWLAHRLTLGMVEHDDRAAACIQCGECDSKCPQQIPISQWMPVVHRVLGEGQPFQTAL